MKFVGIGSVGRMCGAALFMASDNDNLPPGEGSDRVHA